MNEQNQIKIPSLEVGVIPDALGHIWHSLDSGGVKTITSLEQIRISPRCKENVGLLDDGQKLIITTRKKLVRPAEIDGVLQIDGEEEPVWISHRKQEAFDQELKDKGWKKLKTEIAESWETSFVFRCELLGKGGEVIRHGLRPPQIGGLHAIGAHWSLHQQPATIVMPTGTGKTETMLASLVAYNPGTTLVIVPSHVLREQTAKKFLTLGLLRALENLSPTARNPIVGVITRRPTSKEDLQIFEKCNVLISTMSAIGEGSAVPLIPSIAERVDTLIVDEAHHVAARGWAAFREQFTKSKILQFTATPYRRDGKLVDGKVIYNYPLSAAQNDGYFKKISFLPVYDIDRESGDQTVAAAAVERLRNDLAAGRDHLMMARCSNIDRATTIHGIYTRLAADLAPVLVHSESRDSALALNQVKKRSSRIMVCVNMLGEGFDLPQLKVAAVHDTHKSLAVLLQFTGRFTRSSSKSVGEATVIANIADQEVSYALERLYSEDADWNQLLSEYSSEAARAHSELVEFLNASKRLDEPSDQETVEVSHHLLRPTLSTLIYEADSFQPKKFFEGLSRLVDVHRVWLHDASNTLYFVTRSEPQIQWTRSRELRDRQWDLFILHYDSTRHLLFLCSSDRSSLHDKLAASVGATRIISGDTIFRALGKINRLIFQNIGIRKHGRRNLSYALYTGADVANALSISETTGAVKSNLSGSGWENGAPTTIGCSHKGRVWSRDVGTVPEFVTWCESVGQKLQDDSIDTTEIIANVLIPEEINQLPDQMILSVDWPYEMLRQSEERVTLLRSNQEMPISMFGIEIVRSDIGASEVEFRICSASGEVWASPVMSIGGTEGFKVSCGTGPSIGIRVGSIESSLEEYLSNYPPMLRFIDLSELDGNLLIKPQSTQEIALPEELFEVWDWEGVDISKESFLKDGVERSDSIQWRAAQAYIQNVFDVIFNDDAPGEAADLVCLKEEADHIRCALVHCKFTKGTNAGERVADVVEVASQAVRSAKWKWKFRDLCRHLVGREKRLCHGAGTRFIVGNVADLNRYVRVSRFKEVRAEIVIVQPGLSRKDHSPDQVAVLAAAHSFLKETIGVDLDVVCSS
jgi:superfamily II DNA or RNA helicase